MDFRTREHSLGEDMPFRPDYDRSLCLFFNVRGTAVPELDEVPPAALLDRRARPVTHLAL